MSNSTTNNFGEGALGRDQAPTVSYASPRRADRESEASRPASGGNRNPLLALLKALASLRLTVVLLALAIIVIFAGTWAQRFADVWQVQTKYFHSYFCWVELNLFLPMRTPADPLWGRIVEYLRPVRIPMVGGYLLIILMLVNLVAAHGLRFKPRLMDLALLPLLAAMLFAPQWILPTSPTGWMAATVGGMPLITILAYTPLIAAFIAAIAFLHGRRTGVILIHLALILLLAGELITSRLALESRMSIEEGQTTSWSQDIRDPELAVIDSHSFPDRDRVVSVHRSRLTKGEVVRDADLPFDIKVEEYFRNADILGPFQAQQRKIVDRATAGEFKGQLVAVDIRPVSGVGEEASMIDVPAAYVTLTSKSGQSLGTYLVAAQFGDRPQTVTVDGKDYGLVLRFRRHYRPFTLHLKDFSHDLYPGTNVPKNFSSLVRLVDPQRGVDREVLIWMNHPLRYRGETFFQADWNKMTNRGTVLQVVRNPGERFPYIACALGGLGLVIHFAITLLRFIQRETASSPALAAPFARPAVSRAPAPPPPPSGGKRSRDKRGASSSSGSADGPRGSSYTLQPRRPRWTGVPLVAALITGLLCGVYLVMLFGRPSTRGSEAYDFASFGKIPISYEGRQQPLDSLARNALKVISGQSTLRVEVENPSDLQKFFGMTTTRRPATQWLADLWAREDVAADAKIFRIDHDDVKRLIAPENAGQQDEFVGRKRFSLREVLANGKKLDEQFAALPKDAGDRDVVQNKLAELGQKLNVYFEVRNVGQRQVIPPAKAGGDWRALDEVVQQTQHAGEEGADPYVAGLISVLRAYHNQQPGTFNESVSNYLARVDGSVPRVMAKVRSETTFNRIDPFLQSTLLYVVVFLLVAVSWLVPRVSRGFYGAAWGVLAVTLAFHTLALVWRVYLSGRPPVTNLYSSAIFIAWGAALLAAGIEVFFRNSFGLVTAAVIGFLSLVVAQNLVEGDTMKVLQAVLDTNFWLATHVLVITLGYAATFLAGFLGIVHVIGGLFGAWRADPSFSKALGRMVYGIVCFALLFSFIGTVLGGIWADQSWGRFWGWDPKENGAVLIVLWNALILHARWCGLVRERGLMNLAIFGNVVTAWSWFGTNMMGIGLHSYGFMESAAFWLAAFVFTQLALILLGSLPIQRSTTGGSPAPAV